MPDVTSFPGYEDLARSADRVVSADEKAMTFEMETRAGLGRGKFVWEAPEDGEPLDPLNETLNHIWPGTWLPQTGRHVRAVLKRQRLDDDSTAQKTAWMQEFWVLGEGGPAHAARLRLSDAHDIPGSDHIPELLSAHVHDTIDVRDGTEVRSHGLVLSRIRGAPLRDLLPDDAFVPVGDWEVVRQLGPLLLRFLGYCHDAGLLLGDPSENNFLVECVDGKWIVRFCDFEHADSRQDASHAWAYVSTGGRAPTAVHLDRRISVWSDITNVIWRICGLIYGLEPHDAPAHNGLLVVPTGLPVQETPELPHAFEEFLRYASSSSNLADNARDGLPATARHDVFLSAQTMADVLGALTPVARDEHHLAYVNRVLKALVDGDRVDDWAWVTSKLRETINAALRPSHFRTDDAVELVRLITMLPASQRETFGRVTEQWLDDVAKERHGEASTAHLLRCVLLLRAAKGDETGVQDAAHALGKATSHSQSVDSKGLQQVFQQFGITKKERGALRAHFNRDAHSAGTVLLNAAFPRDGWTTARPSRRPWRLRSAPFLSEKWCKLILDNRVHVDRQRNIDSTYQFRFLDATYSGTPGLLFTIREGELVEIQPKTVPSDDVLTASLTSFALAEALLGTQADDPNLDANGKRTLEAFQWVTPSPEVIAKISTRIPVRPVPKRPAPAANVTKKAAAPPSRREAATPIDEVARKRAAKKAAAKPAAPKKTGRQRSELNWGAIRDRGIAGVVVGLIGAAFALAAASSVGAPLAGASALGATAVAAIHYALFERKPRRSWVVAALALALAQFAVAGFTGAAHDVVAVAGVGLVLGAAGARRRPYAQIGAAGMGTLAAVHLAALLFFFGLATPSMAASSLAYRVLPEGTWPVERAGEPVQAAMPDGARGTVVFGHGDGTPAHVHDAAARLLATHGPTRPDALRAEAAGHHIEILEGGGYISVHLALDVAEGGAENLRNRVVLITSEEPFGSVAGETGCDRPGCGTHEAPTAVPWVGSDGQQDRSDVQFALHHLRVATQDSSEDDPAGPAIKVSEGDTFTGYAHIANRPGTLRVIGVGVLDDPGGSSQDLTVISGRGGGVMTLAATAMFDPGAALDSPEEVYELRRSGPADEEDAVSQGGASEATIDDVDVEVTRYTRRPFDSQPTFDGAEGGFTQFRVAATVRLPDDASNPVPMGTHQPMLLVRSAVSPDDWPDLPFLDGRFTKVLTGDQSGDPRPTYLIAANPRGAYIPTFGSAATSWPVGGELAPGGVWDDGELVFDLPTGLLASGELEVLALLLTGPGMRISDTANGTEPFTILGGGAASQDFVDWPLVDTWDS